VEWSSSDMLAVFPFHHRVELAATLCPESLTLETTVVANSESPVPVSFGFHPYFGFSEPSRANWHLKLPAMRKLVLDGRGIPTGDEEPFAGFNAELGESSFDDGFALMVTVHGVDKPWKPRKMGFPTGVLNGGHPFGSQKIYCK